MFNTDCTANSNVTNTPRKMNCLSVAHTLPELKHCYTEMIRAQHSAFAPLTFLLSLLLTPAHYRHSSQPLPLLPTPGTAAHYFHPYPLQLLMPTIANPAYYLNYWPLLPLQPTYCHSSLATSTLCMGCHSTRTLGITIHFAWGATVPFAWGATVPVLWVPQYPLLMVP